jgi:hypothetical protein
MQGIPQIGQTQSSGNIPIQGPVGISLVLGEVVRGEVLNILPDAVSMRVKKEIVLAKTDIPLEQGKFYLFRVESITNNEAKLKVIQTLTEEATATNNTILKALESMKGAVLSHDQIIAFKRILEQIPESVWKRLPTLTVLQRLFKNTDTITEGTLKESLNASGGYFETKLRAWAAGLGETENVKGGEEVDQIIENDLKGSLLKLKESLQDTEIRDLLKAGGAKAEVFSEAADKLLLHIEQQQFTSKMNMAFQTFIPFVWQGLKEGNLTFKESYRAHEGEMEHACVITLDLENVGRLVTQVQLFSDRLHVRFITENSELTTLLEENKPILERQLSDVGLTCNSLAITQEKTIKFENFISPFELDIEI